MKMNFMWSLCLMVLVTACGGGGGSDKSSTTSSSSIANTIVANAGTNISVNEGAIVNLNPAVAVTNPTGFTSGSGNLEITGSSTKASDIVKLKWTLQQGALSGISTTDTTSGKFSFVAPDTEGNISAEIIYQLTLTNAAGQTASDTVTITINRVNTLPLVNAGIDQSVESESQVTLSGTATDAEGGLKSYAWVQKTGSALTLTNADKATASFIAPSVTEPTTYEFELTVADADDATATDKIIVTVSPKDTPRITIYFPTPVGIYNETTISAFGSAEAVNANLSKVEVSTGNDFTEATLSDGKWRLDNITVPDTDTFEVIVKVTDSLGRISQKKSSLKKSGAQGSGQTWSQIIALGVDNENQRVLAFANGENLSDIRVFPIDLTTGNRGNDISNFSKSDQGVQNRVISQAQYDSSSKVFYYTLNPASALLNLQVNEVSVVTGQRKIISENAQSLTPAPSSFVNPIGITSNQQGKIFVADNAADKIIEVDVLTGLRTPLFDAESAIGVAIDPLNPNDLFLFSYANSVTILKTLLDVKPFSFAPVTMSELTIDGPAISKSEQMEADNELKKLFVVDGSNQLFEVDVTNRKRTQIESVSVAGKGYDHNRHLFYYNDSDKNAIWILDPVSKHKVMISGSMD